MRSRRPARRDPGRPPGLERSYWAQAAAVAVAGSGLLAGATLVRSLHRAAGTFTGLLLATAAVALHPQGAYHVLTVTTLMFTAQLLVSRNYALSVCFTTPLALLISEADASYPSPGPLLASRATPRVESFLHPEIAARLVVSEATVKTHINNLFAKADLHSRAEAVRYALSTDPSAD
ncbi:FUSC family protein [Streptomyces sp. NPDC006172]|uniref:FUSC family protein n=1 Tax=Streptomyces sp. NPDC006172 TaxID=3154470 RepID=UPI0033C8E2C9